MTPDTAVTVDSIAESVTTPQLAFLVVAFTGLSFLGTWAYATVMDRQRNEWLEGKDCCRCR